MCMAIREQLVLKDPGERKVQLENKVRRVIPELLVQKETKEIPEPQERKDLKEKKELQERKVQRKRKTNRSYKFVA